MKKRNKTILVICGVIVGLMAIPAIYLFLIISALPDGRNYSTAELIESFNENRDGINDAKKYLSAITPTDKAVEVEFDGDNIAYMSVRDRDTVTGEEKGFASEDRDISMRSARADTLLKILGWDETKLTALKEKLDKANCISITNSEPAKVGFKRSGFGMYFFNVFDKPLAESLKAKYNDSCTYIYVNRNLVLEYGGGAIGPQCFSELK
ncbi:hypothetical protein D0C36_05555 [Mucilaginibacter conchicola]|uniref:Uncharacterized protein n=1 Tax=Mucilaginibacter conchicola TaxID=2303333 RepID=A0A372NXZ5_9SPHI|nr:hypothetical protein [Mucilaginibacter conchicola]RFZ94993.1 hypothetical protein D0C36_05555 [Mucilaginibacter conchicola]